MKHFRILLVAVLLAGIGANPAQAQFKSLLKKAADKILKTQDTKTTQDNNGTSTPEEPATAPENKTHSGPSKGAAPVFDKTGKMVKAVGVTYSIDQSVNSAILLQKPVIIKGIKVARAQGMSGTDSEILNKVMEDPQLFGQIGAQLGNDPANAKGLNEVLDIIRPSQTFGALGGAFHYYITNNYIRAELANSPSSVAKGMFDSLGGAVAIVDIQAKKSYAISNYLNLVPAAVVEDVKGFQDVFGMADQFKKLLNQPNLHASALGLKQVGKYSASGVRIEIPVKPGVDKEGKPDDGMLYLHCLFNNKWSDFEAKNYDPKYKLYLEMYYSHDLDKIIPEAVIRSKGILGFDGFFVGYTLKDENGRQVSYGIKNIETGTTIDEGLLMVPQGYPKMTQEELDAQVLKRMGLKK